MHVGGKRSNEELWGFLTADGETARVVLMEICGDIGRNELWGRGIVYSEVQGDC